MKKLTSYLLLTATILFITEISLAQNNLAAGDIAIVSYQSDFDPTNTFTVGIAEFEDRFSIVVLKAGGLAAGTVIFFTTRGWNAVSNNWHDVDYPPFTFGLGRRAVVQWTVPAGGIATGTEVFFINKFHDEVASPNEYYDWGAYSNHAGTIPLGVVANVTPIVPAANGTDGMGFSFSGDHLLVYQTGPVAGPTGGFNGTPIRFITALHANNNGTTTYASWDPAPGPVNSESSLPPGLVNGQTAFLMSPGPLPATQGTNEPDNGKFSNCALSTAGTCTPLQMCAIIYDIANWTFNNAVFPAGTSSSFCTYNIIAPVSYSLQPSAVTACSGLPVSFTVTAAGGGTLTYQWQESANAAFTPATTLNNTGVYSGTGTNTLSISDNTGLTGRYYRAIVTGPCGAVNSNGVQLTVTNPALSGNNTTTQAVNAQNNLYYATSCGIISKVVPSGASPVTGNLTSQVWVEGTVPTFAGLPFVQRHYQLTPGTNPATATATVTLYFSQAEFNAYNSHPNSLLDLPTGTGDAVGKANLRVAQYKGSSSNSSGLPGTYPAGSGSIIDPPDANIVFNATFSRWEVTFTVTGFSGFIVQTNLTVLPVKLISFRAQRINNDILANWQAASEINNDHFELERSTDGRNFLLAGQVPGINGNLITDYSLTDAGAAGLTVSKLFYRLKMISKAGTEEYSNIVMVPLNNRALFVTGIAPNPFSDKLTINLNLPSKGKLGMKITDIAGKELYSKETEMLNGYSAVTIPEVSRLSGGVYLLSVNFNGETIIYKLVK